MYKKISVFMLFVLFAVSHTWAAADLEQTVSKVVEQKVAAVADLNPHLSVTQMQEVENAWKDLFANVYMSAPEAVQSWVDSYRLYALGECGLLGEYVSGFSHLDSYYQMRNNVSAYEKDLHAHAVDFALYQLVPQEYKELLGYKQAKYQTVVNWAEFNKLCQLYLEDIHETLLSMKGGPGRFGNSDCSLDRFFSEFMYREISLQGNLQDIAACVQDTYQNIKELGFDPGSKYAQVEQKNMLQDMESYIVKNEVCWTFEYKDQEAKLEKLERETFKQLVAQEVYGASVMNQQQNGATQEEIAACETVIRDLISHVADCHAAWTEDNGLLIDEAKTIVIEMFFAQ